MSSAAHHKWLAEIQEEEAAIYHKEIVESALRKAARLVEGHMDAILILAQITDLSRRNTQVKDALMELSKDIRKLKVSR